MNIRRFKKTMLYLGALLLKPFPFLHDKMPYRLRETLRSWDTEMLWMWVKTGGRRRYIDKRATLVDPPSFAPKVSITGEHALTEADLQFFYENGYLGPFTLCSEEEMDQLRPEIERVLTEPSKIYGFVTPRDHHLDNAAIADLIQRPAAVDRLAQLMGPDLLVWRTQIFNKPPSAGVEFTWHQASSYLTEQGFKPTLEPESLSELFQVTTWIAVDKATLENGCLQVVPGSHREIRTIRPGQGGFGHARIQLEYDIDPEKVVNFECRPGQFVIFTERLVHGSQPNTSDKRRLGMAFRTILPNVKCYRDQKTHAVEYIPGQVFPLDKWGCVILRGEDKYGLNPSVGMPTRETAALPGATEGTATSEEGVRQAEHV